MVFFGRPIGFTLGAIGAIIATIIFYVTPASQDVKDHLQRVGDTYHGWKRINDTQICRRGYGCWYVWILPLIGSLIGWAIDSSTDANDIKAPTKKLFIDFNSNEIYDFMQKQPKPSEQEVKQTMEKYSKIKKGDK